MKRDEIYLIIQELLQERECTKVPLVKEGLVVKRPEADYVIKVTKKKQ